MPEHLQDTGNGHFSIRWDDPFKEQPNFLERGEEVPVRYDDPEVEQAVNRAIELARVKMRKGLLFEIRGKMRPWTGRSDFGRSWKTREQRNQEWGVAWYFSIDVCAETEEFRKPVAEAVENSLGGYLLIARLRA